MTTTTLVFVAIIAWGRRHSTARLASVAGFRK